MARATLEDEWASAQKAEVLVYNSAALGGYHIGEKLGVPAFASFPAPLYSPTREFPSPFLPFRNLGPFNQWSHRFFATLGPAMYRRPINAWRREALGLLPATGESVLRGQPITTLYAYSPAVVPRPADWDASAVVTGYWFLEASPGWRPDPALVQFLQAGPPPVYVGFGSMFMNGGARKTEIVLNALRLAGQRGILATGWSGLSADDAPDNVFFWRQFRMLGYFLRSRRSCITAAPARPPDYAPENPPSPARTLVTNPSGAGVWRPWAPDHSRSQPTA